MLTVSTREPHVAVACAVEASAVAGAITRATTTHDGAIWFGLGSSVGFVIRRVRHPSGSSSVGFGFAWRGAVRTSPRWRARAS